MDVAGKPAGEQVPKPPTSYWRENPRLAATEAKMLLAALPDWSIVVEETERLAATFAFADFAAALTFAGRVGDLAEAANHHPMLVVEWGRVQVFWWTHAIGGLHRNDFILAARTSALLDPRSPPRVTRAPRRSGRRHR